MAVDAQAISTHEGNGLKVVRVSSRTGLWLWRTAQYVVYHQEGDGTKTKLLSGRFRNHKDALLAARELLR